MLIDVNAHIGRWPFLQYGPTTPAELEAALRQAGVGAACVSAIEAILAPDPSLEEARLHQQIQGNDFFIHTPLVSPMLHDWRDRLRQAREEYGSPMVRLLPSYHRYAADGAEARAIAEAAAEMGLQVALLLRVEDERAHYPLMPVPAPTLEQAAALARVLAPRPLLVLGAYRWEMATLAAEDNTCFDLPLAESGHPMRDLTASLGAERLLFGSLAPFQYVQAQARKLRFGQLPGEQEEAIGAGNAAVLLERGSAKPQA